MITKYALINKDGHYLSGSVNVKNGATRRVWCESINFAYTYFEEEAAQLCRVLHAKHGKIEMEVYVDKWNDEYRAEFMQKFLKWHDQIGGGDMSTVIAIKVRERLESIMYPHEVKMDDAINSYAVIVNEQFKALPVQKDNPIPDNIFDSIVDVMRNRTNNFNLSLSEGHEFMLGAVCAIDTILGNEKSCMPVSMYVNTLRGEPIEKRSEVISRLETKKS